MSDENIHFQVIITDNGNGSCQGATCPRFMSFNVFQHILVVKITEIYWFVQLERKHSTYKHS